MLDFIKQRFVVAEVDGIKFYRDKSLQRYLAWRDEQAALEQSRKGKNLYTFELPFYQENYLPIAKVNLEKNGCFDYSVVYKYPFITVKYWAKQLILIWKKS